MATIQPRSELHLTELSRFTGLIAVLRVIKIKGELHTLLMPYLGVQYMEQIILTQILITK